MLTQTYIHICLLKKCEIWNVLNQRECKAEQCVLWESLQTSLCCTLCNSGGGRKGPLGLRGGDTWVRDEHMLLRSVMKKGGGLERVCMWEGFKRRMQFVFESLISLARVFSSLRVFWALAINTREIQEPRLRLSYGLSYPRKAWPSCLSIPTTTPDRDTNRSSARSRDLLKKERLWDGWCEWVRLSAFPFQEKNTIKVTVTPCCIWGWNTLYREKNSMTWWSELAWFLDKCVE